MPALGALHWAIELMKKTLGVVLSPIMETVMKFVFQPILDAFASAVGTLMSTIATFWVYVPTIAVEGDPGQPANGAVSWIWGHTQFVALFIAALGLIVGAIQMAWSQRGETARDMLRSLITLAVATAFTIAVAQVLISAGDLFSKCIISSALDSHSTTTSWVDRCNELGSGDSTDFGKRMTIVLGFAAVANIAGSPLLIGIMIAIGVLTVIASMIQIVLMVVRSAMLVLLIGVLPLAAAATNTEMGRNWFKRIISWLLAFILYKPVAAIVYATAIRLVSDKGTGPLNQPYKTDAKSLENLDNVGHIVMNVVTGLTMLVLALFAMPALMRFIVPMVGATAGGAGAGMIAAKLSPGLEKLGDMANKGADQGGSSGSGGGGDGPTGAQNVGRASQQAPSTGGGGGGAAGGEGAAAAGGEGAGAAGAAGGAGGGAAAGGAAGGGAAAAGGGAAAAAGPAAVAVVAVKAGMDATKAFGQMAASETIGNDEMDQGGGGGGGGGGGPSGSTGTGDPNRQGPSGQQGFNDDNSGGPPPPPAPDGPSGSG